MSGVDVVVVQAASVAVANMAADTCLIILPPLTLSGHVPQMIRNEVSKTCKPWNVPPSFRGCVAVMMTVHCMRRL